MIRGKQIIPGTAVVCSKNGQFAVVDHMEDEQTIKLKKDKLGQHHYIPLSWVTNVDDKVHVNRPGEQAMLEWWTSPQGKNGAETSDKAANEHMRNPSSTDQKKMKINPNQEQPTAHIGATGRTGDQNKGHMPTHQ